MCNSEETEYGLDDPLPDDAWVVRGGLMTNGNLDDGTEWEDRFQAQTMCVGSYPGLSVEDIATEWPYRGRHMCRSTVARLRAEGFDVLPDRAEGRVHAMLSLPGEPSDDVWDLLRSCFEEPEPNPAYSGRG